jgi:hypothetical protein
VALRTGRPGLATTLLEPHFGPPYQEAAAYLRAHCRDGSHLPGDYAPLTGFAPGRGLLHDTTNSSLWQESTERLFQSLTHACLDSGNAERAFDVATVAVNMDPGNLESRRLLGDVYRRLHLDAAAARLAAEPSAPTAAAAATQR